MHLIPVIDLKGGAVVRAVAGQRHQYQPVESRIADQPAPSRVAQVYRDLFGFSQTYVADLDAISGTAPNWDAYRSIAACGLELILDAGVGDDRRAQTLHQYASRHAWLTGIVVGLESLRRREDLHEVFTIIGPHLAIFSLDLLAGRPKTNVADWEFATPREIADEAVAFGFRRVVILDLAAVGTRQGPATIELCQELHRAYPHLAITTGGGIRSVADLCTLRDAGCHAALVASALHDAHVTPEEVRTFSRKDNVRTP